MSKLLEKYIKDCLRTESKLENLKINVTVTDKLFQMFDELTEVLDGLKKSAFYGKDDKLVKMFHHNLLRIKLLSEELLTKTTEEIIEKEETSYNPRMFHGILGIMTEAGELAVTWERHMDGEPFDQVNIQEEMGDQLWYHSIINDELKLDPVLTMKKNIKKLKKRFPDKFTKEKAEKRDLVAERKILEE